MYASIEFLEFTGSPVEAKRNTAEIEPARYLKRYGATLAQQNDDGVTFTVIKGEARNPCAPLCWWKREMAEGTYVLLHEIGGFGGYRPSEVIEIFEWDWIEYPIFRIGAKVNGPYYWHRPDGFPHPYSQFAFGTLAEARAQYEDVKSRGGGAFTRGHPIHRSKQTRLPRTWEEFEERFVFAL